MTPAERRAFYGPFEDRSRRRVQQELFRSILASHEYLVDLEARLRKMQQLPVMILFGDDDATYRAGWAQKFEDIFPKHRTVILKGGHHFPPEYDPQAIASAIRDWYPTIK
jgi:haloalkane dehalogenase